MIHRIDVGKVKTLYCKRKYILCIFFKIYKFPTLPPSSYNRCVTLNLCLPRSPGCVCERGGGSFYGILNKAVRANIQTDTNTHTTSKHGSLCLLWQAYCLFAQIFFYSSLIAQIKTNGRVQF